LGEELTPLALFFDPVSAEIKQRMVVRMNECERQRGTLERSTTYSGKEDLSEKTLDNFIWPASQLFFRILQIDKTFMECAIHLWSEQASYQKARKLVSILKVVNDAAERGIALATNFSTNLTKREDEKQLLFQMVEMHRKRLPKATKSAALGTESD
jgi:hypothetical protein